MTSASYAQPQPREPSRAERRADAFVHALGLGLMAPALAVLVVIVAPLGGAHLVSALAYAAGAVATFALSAAYNLARDARRRARLRPFDHAAIFAMIAGSYSPFALVATGGAAGRELLAFVWTVAALGIALKLARPGRWERASVVLYLALGWCAVPFLGPLGAALAPATVALLVAGGVLYSAGTAVHLARRLPFQNALWHAAVLAGAACHYAAVVRVLA